MPLLDYTFIQFDGADLTYADVSVIWSLNVLPDSPPTGFNDEDYAHLLSSLFPIGQAWPRTLDALVQTVIGSLALELRKVDERVMHLFSESDPRSSSELLLDWERLCGLPDPCVTSDTLTVQQRRAAVSARLTSAGGQSKAFFIEYAYRFGFQITIDEFFDTPGSEHLWRINAPSVTVSDFRAGEATAGEPLRSWGNEALECAINRLKPAHTELIFAYA